MQKDEYYRNVCAVLKECERKWRKREPKLRVEILASRDTVYQTYGPVFSPRHISRLKQSEFEDFLLLKNNQHWTGLHRRGPTICSNMPALRQGLAQLLNGKLSLSQRYDECDGHVEGMGKAISTAILMVSSRGQYGVWNNRSEKTLKGLGLWPSFPRGTSDGAKYEIMNALLNNLAKDLGLDLWYLDTLLWHIDEESGGVSREDAAFKMDMKMVEAVTATEREALIASRIGQGQFRGALIGLWGGCSVTKVKEPGLLRASHIRPWKDCTNEMRLDRFNGLLLMPNLDHLFDKGYISFDDSGRILISRALTERDLGDLGVKATMKLRKVHAKSATYLQHHRKEVYKP